jgi:hypothetical protein
MQQVAYIYNETREANILRTLLKDFTGTLVSDFYPAYEGIQCSQQKCLIHLIRDLNDDVLKHPFDEELKWLVRTFAELLRPMVETIDRHGLRARFLKQHFASVDRFYQRLRKLSAGHRDVKLYGPWELAVYLAVPSKTKALDLERYFKSGSGRAFLQRHILEENAGPGSSQE